jgi:hypothetical protein
MKHISLLRKSLIVALATISTQAFSQTTPSIPTLPAGDSIIFVYDVTISTGVTSVSNQGNISLSYFNNVNTNDPKTAAAGDATVTLVGPATFYPKITATDLSAPADWTSDVNGGAGTSPANFTTNLQLFTINNNVAAPVASSAWNISSGSNVTLTNTSGLILNPAARLTVGLGSEVNLNGNALTLKSDATGTASIGETNGTISNATNVTVERYIGPARRAWRLLTAPLQSGAATIYNSWQEAGAAASAGKGTHITGGTLANGFDQNAISNPSILQYTNATDALTVPANTNATAVSSQPGWFLFVRGDRTINLAQGSAATPNATVLRANGILKQGIQPTIAVAAANSTLVGNPFASPIDWSLISAGNRTNVANRFYVWDPKLSGANGVGGYVLFDANTATPFTPNVGGGSYTTGVPNTLIQSGQAFFVNSTGAAGSLILMENIKSATNQQVFRLNGGVTEQLHTQLMVVENGTPSPVDGVYSVFHETGSESVTGEDAPKLNNFNENLSIKRNNKQLALEKRPLVDANDTIFLNLTGMKTTAYQFAFTPTNLAASGLTAYMEDAYLQTRTAISLSNSSSIDFNVNSDVASFAADRFRVVFKTAAVLPVNFTTIKAAKKASDIEVEWKVASEQNIRSYEVEKSVDGRKFDKMQTVTAKSNNGAAVSYTSLDVAPNNSANYYRIKAVENSNAYKYSAVVKVNLQKENAEISVYPNPAKDKLLNIQMINKAKGVYAVQLINSLGQVVHSKLINHDGGSATQTLQLSSAVAKGVYQMIISGGEMTQTQQVIIN